MKSLTWTQVKPPTQSALLDLLAALTSMSHKESCLVLCHKESPLLQIRHLNLFRMFMYVGARPLYLSNFSSVSDFVSSTFFNLYTLQLLLNYAAFSIVKLFLLSKIQSVTPII